MSIIAASARRFVSDHFMPEAQLDPQQQRKMRGHLEQIDYAAYAANREVLSSVLGQMSLATFQKLAVAASRARGLWVSAAIEAAKLDQPPAPADVARLASLRASFDELSEAYEALRRMVERGYVNFKSER